MDLRLPTAVDFTDLLGCELKWGIAKKLEDLLVAPAAELLSRPSKGLRGQLVRLGADLVCTNVSSEQAAALAKAAAAMELLHAGSLIIDDIQDGSARRRGGPSVHLLYGVPTALCTGNWLYVWPLRLLSHLGLPLADEHRLFRCYHAALEQAHYGQALDLNIKVDELPRGEVSAYCDAVIALKTGSITALAMTLGAIIGGGDGRAEEALKHFGEGFGRALQHYDDLGDLLGRVEPSKRYEDLRQRKPNGVWSMVAQTSDDAGYAAFQKAVRQLDEAPQLLTTWLEERQWAQRARGMIEDDMHRALRDLQEALHLSEDYPALSHLRQLGELLTDAY